MTSARVKATPSSLLLRRMIGTSSRPPEAMRSSGSTGKKTPSRLRCIWSGSSRFSVVGNSKLPHRLDEPGDVYAPEAAEVEGGAAHVFGELSVSLIGCRATTVGDIRFGEASHRATALDDRPVVQVIGCGRS